MRCSLEGSRLGSVNLQELVKRFIRSELFREHVIVSCADDSIKNMTRVQSGIIEVMSRSHGQTLCSEYCSRIKYDDWKDFPPLNVVTLYVFRQMDNGKTNNLVIAYLPNDGPIPGEESKNVVRKHEIELGRLFISRIGTLIKPISNSISNWNAQRRLKYSYNPVRSNDGLRHRLPD